MPDPLPRRHPGLAYACAVRAVGGDAPAVRIQYDPAIYTYGDLPHTTPPPGSDQALWIQGCTLATVHWPYRGRCVTCGHVRTDTRPRCAYWYEGQDLMARATATTSAPLDAPDRTVT